MRTAREIIVEAGWTYVVEPSVRLVFSKAGHPDRIMQGASEDEALADARHMLDLWEALAREPEKGDEDQ